MRLPFYFCVPGTPVVAIHVHRQEPCHSVPCTLEPGRITVTEEAHSAPSFICRQRAGYQLVVVTHGCRAPFNSSLKRTVLK